MKASVSTVTKTGKVKTIVGNVIDNGFSHIVLFTYDKNGSSQIKRFNKSKYTVTIIEEV